MFRMKATREVFSGTGEDFLHYLEVQARYGRNVEEGVAGRLGESLNQLAPFVGRTLLVRSLDGRHIIEKSRFIRTDAYAPDLTYGYVTDHKQPRVAEAIGRLDTLPAFDDYIRLKGRDYGIFGGRAYYQVQVFDAALEPRVSIEVIEPK